ncbi:XRE family transcriptional regulator [Pseudomonas atacamensis]|uniref:helix-turn-helix domain-containing protein n=1 Tax=Pseudomonas atacamensis TaxID=2565368 RepID=UPI002B4953DA|nr:XRE family transcriptional regulator [Pseudomonas atacamensis]MEB2854099.1 XRE family transcriptional regulator [Pseudomonas atacamensis]
MTTVFIAGSIAISRLDDKVKARIENIVASDLDIVVGDADGADTSIQECLREFGAKRVTVYCSGDHPRNNLAQWPVANIYPNSKPGSRAFFTAKDLEMARTSNYGLMIWDCKSTGTLSNVIELIKENKKSVVFINKNKEFLNISNPDDLNHLVAFMSEFARSKAEQKIGLSSKIHGLAQEQYSLIVDSDLNDKEPTDDSSSTTNDFSEASVITENMKLREKLITAIENHVKSQGWTQAEAAIRLGVTQPRISDLLRHKTNVFGLDSLVNMVSATGMHIEMRIAEPAL